MNTIVSTTTDDMVHIQACAQVILNLCSSPIDGRKQLDSIEYAAMVLQNLAHAACEQIDHAEVCHA